MIHHITHWLQFDTDEGRLYIYVLLPPETTGEQASEWYHRTIGDGLLRHFTEVIERVGDDYTILRMPMHQYAWQCLQTIQLWRDV
jgi:hypothetical protein